MSIFALKCTFCHPERSEGSREHKVDDTEILRHYVPLNDKNREQRSDADRYP